MKEQYLALTGAAFVDVNATTFANYVKIVEDASGAAAGLKVKFPADGFTQVYEYAPGVPIEIGTPNNTGAPGKAPMLGKPDRTVPIPKADGTYLNQDEPATIYCKIDSMGAATKARVIEMP